MKYRTRTYYTGVQKALMSERWKQGWTLHQRPVDTFNGCTARACAIDRKP